MVSGERGRNAIITTEISFREAVISAMNFSGLVHQHPSELQFLLFSVMFCGESDFRVKGKVIAEKPFYCVICRFRGCVVLRSKYGSKGAECT